MKKKTEKQAHSDMLPEYDFTGKKGIRGKYYRAYRQGHQVRIYREDGTVKVQYFKLEDGAVMLDPDVQEFFPDSEIVNQALRSLIALVPSKPIRHRKTSRSRYKGASKH